MASQNVCLNELIVLLLPKLQTVTASKGRLFSYQLKGWSKRRFVKNTELKARLLEYALATGIAKIILVHIYKRNLHAIFLSHTLFLH